MAQVAIIGKYYKDYQLADQACKDDETVIDYGDHFLLVKKSIARECGFDV
jgi:hypothetical protein